jgi:pyruvate kinase
MSFVRKKEDVISLQRRIKKSSSTAKVIAKIEKPEAVKNIDEIIECADGIMIARGDLGVELPAHKVPVLQKKIVNKCRFASKPCIIATQMLESMTNNFSATRAEINDVSNSVFDGADALMLSGETSIGIQPLKVVDTMRKTIKDAEKSMEDFEFKKIKGRVSTNRKVADNICKNAVKAANDLKAKAIISATYSGYSALKVSSYRPRAFIYAFTNNHSILNTMSIFWGVVGIYYDRGSTTDQLVQETIEVLQKNKIVKRGDLVINTASMPAKEKGGTNTLKISRV